MSWACDVNPKLFLKGQYKRTHKWKFDSGQIIEASASPEVVPLPFSSPNMIDPEEAFVASLSSCHMLWFINICQIDGLMIYTYHDDPVGILEENNGTLYMTEINLRPTIQIDQKLSQKKLSSLHRAAHAKCFLANSVKSKINIHPNQQIKDVAK